MPKKKIGRVVIGILIGLIAVKISGGKQEELYGTDCSNAEYIDTEVINYNNTITIPMNVETKSGCTLNIDLNTQSRNIYYSMQPNDRKSFRIKGVRNGEFINVYNIYKNNIENRKKVEVILTKKLLKETGSSSKCWIEPIQTIEYCFNKIPKINNKIYKLEIEVDSNNTIIEVKQL